MPTISDASPISLQEWETRVAPRIAVAENGCWEWTHTKLPHGYGRVRINGPQYYTHRLAVEVWKGPIPVGFEVDHLCRNRSCCNPDHLEAVPQRTNILRSTNFAAEKFAQSSCINGHEFDAINTYIAPNGTRKCRECRRVARNNSYHRIKAA